MLEECIAEVGADESCAAGDADATVAVEGAGLRLCGHSRIAERAGTRRLVRGVLCAGARDFARRAGKILDTGRKAEVIIVPRGWRARPGSGGREFLQSRRPTGDRR